MLTELTISNWGPIGNKPFEFSMLPEDNSKRCENKEYIHKTNLQKIPYIMNVAGIYGSNASGKSTIFKALSYMEFLIFDSHRFSREYSLLDERFKFSEETLSGATTVDLSFVAGNKLYNYSVSFKDNYFTNELLTVSENDKDAVTIVCRKSKILHDNFFAELPREEQETAKEYFWNETNSNVLAISRLINRPNNLILGDFIQWWHKRVSLQPGEMISATNLAFSPEDTKDKMIELFNAADLVIEDLTSESIALGGMEILPPEFKDIYDNQVPSFMKEKGKEFNFPAPGIGYYKILDNQVELKEFRFITKSKNGKEYSFRLGELSTGTQKLFSHASAIFDALKDGTALFIDEIDGSLHPFLTKMIVDLFQSDETNPLGAQLIFISHDVSLLHKDSLQPEQVYFTAKNSDTLSSELYSLVDFPEVKKNDRNFNYRDKFLKGAFGAVPSVKRFKPDLKIVG